MTNENSAVTVSAPAAEQKVILTAKGIGKAFHDDPVLDGVSIEVREGECLGIIGPSGSGKSTLLRCLNLLEVPTAGRLWIEDLGEYTFGEGDWKKSVSHKQLRDHRSQMAMVFQHYDLFPHLKVWRNVALAPHHVHGVPAAEAEERAKELIARVGLSHRADAFPATLSGGEQQRVAIARALAMDPRLILFDEPTSALDPELSRSVLTVIKELASQGRTMVVVSHEIEFIRQVSHRVVIMNRGKIVEEGPSEEILGNPSEWTRSFIGSGL